MEIQSQDMARKRRVAIYIRVSTQEQKMDGYGLESQRKRLLEYVEQNKALNLETKQEWIFEDVHTGSEVERAGLQKLLKAVDEKKFDAVLVWKIDRLSRSLKHLLEVFERMQKAGCSFISLQENINFNGAIGNLIFQIFGAIAQFERELIKSRTRSGIVASAEMGNYTGTRIPYGYKPIKNPSGKGTQLEIIPKERERVQKIFHWYVYEDMGYGQIATRLNDMGVPQSAYYKRKGAGKWTVHHIEDMIQNSLYRGEFAAVTKDEEGNALPEEEWTIVAIPPCITEMTWNLAQEKRTTRKAKTATDHTYLLSGKIYDVSLPHHPKFSGKPRMKGGRSYRRKQFEKDGKQYPVFEVPTEPLEEAAWGRVKLALKNPEVFIREYFNYERYGKSRLEDMDEELLKLREKKANLELKMERIEEGYDNGVYGAERASEKTAAVQQEVDRIEGRIEDIGKELLVAGLQEQEIEGLRSAAKTVKYNLDKLGRKQKKILIDLFIDRVELDRTPRETGGKRTKWDITVQYYFRFVPEKFASLPKKGRTTKGLTKEDIEDVFGKKKRSGGQYWT